MSVGSTSVARVVPNSSRISRTARLGRWRLATGRPAGARPDAHLHQPTTTRGEKVRSHSNQPYDVVVQQITIAPGGHTGWHTHPGNAVAAIKSGTLTIYDGDDPSCSGRDYPAGTRRQGRLLGGALSTRCFRAPAGPGSPQE